ncbi:MAG: DNA repair exonuclease [bacterium]|nr:DNA repair exonuclease [bacterium]
MPIRLLFVSDTHLGFDFPFKPRVQRRRRGLDFFKMFELALAPAHRGEVDAVLHGGDILFRSKVPPQLVQMAFEPLMELAEKGVPVYLVPGNHERSHIPYRLLASHPNIHIFVRPKTFYLEVNGFTLALAGFPYVRDNVRQNFPRVLEETQWQTKPSHAALLCIHHCVEGSAVQVGTGTHVFRYNSDVIRTADFPSHFAAVLSGHIHRFQVLTKDLHGNPVPVPVFYPGSIERTSFQEKDEAKGYLTMDIEPGDSTAPGGRISRWQFHELPARPMKQLDLQAETMSAVQIETWIKENLQKLHMDSVVNIRVHGKLSIDALNVFNASSLRSLVPATMNVSVNLVELRRSGRRKR